MIGVESNPHLILPCVFQPLLSKTLCENVLQCTNYTQGRYKEIRDDSMMGFNKMDRQKQHSKLPEQHQHHFLRQLRKMRSEILPICWKISWLRFLFSQYCIQVSNIYKLVFTFRNLYSALQFTILLICPNPKQSEQQTLSN